MTVAKRTIQESDLQHLLRQAAAESVVATAESCMAQDPEILQHDHRATRLEEDLAWIAARITERGWDLLPAQSEDARPPIAWAVQEIIEWAEHMVRLECAGDGFCRVPLTWLPRGAHPLGTRDVEAAVNERTELLAGELAEHGVVVIRATASGVAA